MIGLLQTNCQRMTNLVIQYSTTSAASEITTVVFPRDDLTKGGAGGAGEGGWNTAQHRPEARWWGYRHHGGASH